MNAGGLRFHQRLGVRLGAALALLTAVSFTVLGGVLVQRERETLTREFTLRLRAETRSLASAASGPLLRLDPELELHPFVDHALAETSDLVDLVVLDAQGRIQGHRDLRRVGTSYGDWSAAAGDSETVRVEPDVILVEQPIRHLAQPVGRLVARASRAGIERMVREAQFRMAFTGALVTLLVIVAALGLVSLQLRPLDELRGAVQKLGSGDLGARVRVGVHNELGLLADMLNSMAGGLQRAQTELVQKERLDRELEIARDLQSMLLPRQAPPPPGYELQTHYHAALEVSGDYYDVLPLDRDRFALITADVSGKGVPGLVVMSVLRTTLHALSGSGVDPKKALVAANTMLRGAMQRGMFVTCAYGILDVRANAFRYVSAGHCQPVHFGSFGARLLPARGKPLGIFPDPVLASSLAEHSVQLEPGDGILLLTDGLVETFDAGGKPLGYEAVLDCLGRNQARTVADLSADLLGCANHHRGKGATTDDLTLILVRRARASSPSPVEAHA